MEIDEVRYEEIARSIHSADSPVGIDAKKTHILIIHMLEQLSDRMTNLEAQLEQLKRQPEA